MSNIILRPSTFGELTQFATMAAKSKMVPPAYQGKPEDIVLAIQMGSELGLAPMQSLQGIAVINSRPSVWGDALIGLCRSSAACEDIAERIEGEGDNRTALAIFGLQDSVLDMDGTNTTLDAYYSSLVSIVGVHSQNAQMNAQYNETLLTEYTSRKESISGVNLDEEMALLLQFQRAFQAASKLITTADEMLQTLLSMKQ